MKKKIIFILILTLCITLAGCNTKYKGYYCNYYETAQIIVQLKDDSTSENRSKIEALIETFDNVSSSDYYTKDDYAKDLGEESAEDLDIHETYVILFSSMDNIGTYVDELSKMDGVYSAEQNYAKTNISLYNLKKFGKYTYTDSDEATESELEEGTYKIKNGVITFKPKDSDNSTKFLYIKNDVLCGDADCNEIYAKSDSTCSGYSS